MAKALLFDAGDVLIETPWRQFDELEAARGVRVPGRGALDPAGDPLWQRFLAGEVDSMAYWDGLANGAGYSNWRTMFSDIAEVVGERLFLRDAVALVREAQAAGIPVGVLTNDMVAIQGSEWVRAQPLLAGLDVFIDATEIGVRKPAAAAYQAAIDALGLAAEDIVFLDDTLKCVVGARAVGMTALLVDPVDRAPAFDRARALVGLRPPTPAEAMVTAAEDAYGRRDLDAAMACFHPECVAYWNGELVATGLAEIRRFHMGRLRFGQPMPDGYRLHMTLRASGPDTIAGEWSSTSSVGGEFWHLRDGLIIEWRNFSAPAP
jgi:FMN phosphatase YigB (HAD superfamily)